MKNIALRHMVTLEGYSKDNYITIFENAKEIARKLTFGWDYSPLVGKVLFMIFEKKSTRTRASFYTAMIQLGGNAAVFDEKSSFHAGEGHESDEDTASVLGLYADAIMIRCYNQSKVELYANYSGIPIINGLTDDFHPCQILADIYTLREKIKDDLTGINVLYIGRPNNITNTLIQAASILNFNLRISYPENLEKYINPKFYEIKAKSEKINNKIKIDIIYDPYEAVHGVDVIYTDTWFNTGEYFEDGEKIGLLNIMKPFQVNRKLISEASKNVLFMHCLPAEREVEVTSEILDDKKISIVLLQAKNRLVVQRSILDLLIK